MYYILIIGHLTKGTKMRRYLKAQRGSLPIKESPSYKASLKFYRECHEVALSGYSVRLHKILSSGPMPVEKAFEHLTDKKSTIWCADCDTSVFEEVPGFENSNAEFLCNMSELFTPREMVKALGIGGKL